MVKIPKMLLRIFILSCLLGPNPVWAGGLPDSWGIFEFLHFRSAAQKQADAVELIHGKMISQLDDALSLMTEKAAAAASNHLDVTSDVFELLKKLYPDLNVPADAYRLAVGKFIDDEGAFLKNYKGNPVYFHLQFYGIVDNYYDEGLKPATVTIASVEERHKKLNLKIDPGRSSTP
jgi:hypothetical protein